jgi:hypothetical protein
VIKTSPQKGSTTPEKNITVEFPGVKVKIGTEGLTLEALEELIFDISRGIGQKAFEEVIEGYDKKLGKERPKGLLKNIGKKTKYLQTRVGEIRYRRTLYQEKATNKPRYLLDEQLKMYKKQRMSLKISQILGTLASVEAYRGVAEQISKMLGITYSHEAIRQNVIKEGKRIEEQEEKGLEKVKLLDYRLPDEIPEVLYTETDATCIRKQNKGKKKGRKKRHFEVKLGLNYTGKESRYKTGEKKSKQLKNKSIYAGIKSSRKKFLENLSYISERDYGLSAVRKSYFGGDGDTWIRTGQKDYFPMAEYLLCLYHLFERLRGALPRRKEKQQSIKMLFEKNKVSEALEEIQKAFNDTKDEKERELISEYYVYVKNNRDGIESSIRIKMNEEEHGAGAVESNIDKTIAHRFKKRGMSWSEDGASALLKIRQVIFNGEWDDWWYEKRDKKIEIKAIFKEPLTGKQACMRQDVMPYIEATLPCYRGPDQSKPWVGVLRELSRANLLSEKLITVD